MIKEEKEYALFLGYVQGDDGNWYYKDDLIHEAGELEEEARKWAKENEQNK